MDYPRLPTAIRIPAKPAGFQPLILRRDATSLAFPAGTQMTATVLKQSPGSNFVKLLVAGKPLLAQSHESFTAGQILRLEVAKAGKTPTLRVLSAAGKHNAVRQTLMEALPKQIKLSTLYNDLFFVPLTDKKSVLQPLLRRRLNDIGLPESRPLLREASGKALESDESKSSNQERVGYQSKATLSVQQLPVLQQKNIKGANESPSISQATTDSNNQVKGEKLTQLTASTTPITLPSPLKALPAVLHPLFMALLNRPNIKTAEGLKKAISQSGLFLEAKLLMDPDMELSGDLKANLLKLRDALKQLSGNTTNPETLAMHEKFEGLQKKVEGAIARIVLNQIASYPADDTSKQQWHIELPVIQKDTTNPVKLLITRDSKNGAGEEKNQWSIDLELEPQGLGRISSRIVFVDNEISTFFRCERSTTNQLINDQLGVLRQRLVQSGINPGNISAQHNKNQATETLTRFQGIVDEKA